jgi:cytoskeleton protein RodZ
MNIGSALREARQDRGLTLQQVSERTKIPVAMLERIEHNDFEHLPGAIFARGYLRAFAASVELEAEPLVDAYVRLTEPEPPAQARVHADSPGAPGGFRLGISPDAVSRLQAAMPFLLTVLVTVGLLGALFALRTRDTSVEAGAPPAAQAERAPAAEQAEAPAAVATAAGPVWPATLEMRFTGVCWLSITADGHSAVYRLVQPGESVTVTAGTEIVVRVGNPSAFSYTLNGVPGRQVGRPGIPVTFRIDHDTYADFVSAGRSDLGV